VTDDNHFEQFEGSRDPPAPSSAALRMRRHRERRRRSLRCVLVELREAEVAALVRLGLLNEEARNDVPAVKAALYQFLDRTFSAMR
jgi:hypothetical protein